MNTKFEAELREHLDGLLRMMKVEEYGITPRSETLDQIMQAFERFHTGQGTALQPFEVQNYKRLMALESRGIDEYRKLRAAPALTSEAVVAFINQLSPWNLATTGIDVLEAYADKRKLESSQALKLGEES